MWGQGITNADMFLFIVATTHLLPLFDISIC